MIAISDDQGLYLLEFVDWCSLEQEIEQLKSKVKIDAILGVTNLIQLITFRLKPSFGGLLREIKTSLHFLGSPLKDLLGRS